MLSIGYVLFTFDDRISLFSRMFNADLCIIYLLVKFIHSEKATKFCEIFTLLLSYVVPVKSKVEILQNFVAFSEYMNFNGQKSFTFY